MMTTNNNLKVGVLSFILGSAVTLALSTILASSTSKQKNERMRQTKKKKESSSGEIDLEKYQTNASRKQLANESYLPPEIRSEQLSRNMLYFGSNGMQSITNASVLV